MSQCNHINDAIVYTFTIGELNFRTMRSVVNDIRRKTDKTQAALILDCDQVTELDSHALLFFLTLNAEMQKKNATLQLKNLSHRLREILVITHTDGVLEVI